MILMGQFWACRQPVLPTDNPELVLKKMFPNSSDFECDTLENNDLMFSFVADGYNSSAIFGRDSTFKNDKNVAQKLQEVQQNWDFTLLPTEVLTGVKSFFKDFDAENVINLDKISRYTGGGALEGIFYDIEYDDGENLVIVQFDAKGKLIQQNKIKLSDLEIQQKEEEGVED
jgi:hypothetical protein